MPPASSVFGADSPVARGCGRAARQPLRRPPAAAGLLLLAAAGACGGPRQVERVTADVPLPAEVANLRFELEHGSITVLAAEDAPERVTFEGEVMRVAPGDAELARLGALDMTPVGVSVPGSDTLALRVPRLPEGLDPATARVALRGVLRCPARLRIEIHTGVGHLKVVGARGGCDLATELGDIAMQRCGGLVRAVTAHGNVLIDGHAGGIEAKAPGGMVQAFLTELGPQGVVVETRDATAVHVPAQAGFELDAVSARGECVNGFGIAVRTAGEGQEMQGTVRQGGPTVRIRSSHGRVAVSANR